MFQLSSVICRHGLVSVRDVLVVRPPYNDRVSVRSMVSGKSNVTTWLASEDTDNRGKPRSPNPMTPGGSAENVVR